MNLRSLASLTALGALWGASFLFIRVAVPQWGPVALIEARCLLAGAALWLVLRALHHERPTWRQHGSGRRYLTLGAVSAALPFTLIAAAELRLPASLAATLNATTPLFALLIGASRGQERLTARRVGGVLVGVGGVAVLVGLGPVRPDVPLLLAVTASLLAALCLGLGGVYAARHFTTVPPTAVAAGQQLAAAALLLPLLPFAPPPELPGARSTWAVLALALPCTALGFALFYRIVAAHGPATALTVTFLVPVFGVLWGALLLDEPLTPGMLVGLAAVLAGVVLVTRGRGATVTGMTSDAPEGPPAVDPSNPVAILTARGVPFRLHPHPAFDTPQEVCAALGIPLEQTVKTLAFTAPDDRLVLAALPGHARLRYGPLARAAGVRRTDLTPASVERLEKLDMQPGGICPWCADESAVVIFDESLMDAGRVYCGSGRRDSSVEIDASELIALIAAAKTAAIAAFADARTKEERGT
ncbi:EamA family transporter [Streptomyces sp. NPDC005476]|uniref:EamA family transporter n=1 Tax=Streptomyces sp. NPDC005476 TaxID=3156882 RepID=UPI003456B05E